MPRAPLDGKQLTKLEAKQRQLHERIIAERRALSSKETRRRAAERLAHEQALFHVLRRFVVESVTPVAFEALLVANGYARKRQAMSGRGEER